MKGQEDEIKKTDAQIMQLLTQLRQMKPLDAQLKESEKWLGKKKAELDRIYGERDAAREEKRK